MLFTKTRKLLVGIDVSGFRSGNVSSYCTDRSGIMKKCIKLSTGVELRGKIACSFKIYLPLSMILWISDLFNSSQNPTIHQK